VAGLGEAAHAPERRCLLRDAEEAEAALAAGALWSITAAQWIQDGCAAS
jgi:hypothetical protein